MGEIADRIAGVTRDTNEVGISWPLQSIDRRIVESVEAMALDGNLNAGLMVAKIREALDAVLSITAYDQIASIFNAFAEAKVWKSFNDHGIHARPIPASNHRTPEFELTWNGRTLYCEVKALNPAGGPVNNERSMEAGFEALVTLEERRQRGDSIAFAEHVVQPQLNPDQIGDYDPYGRRILIRNVTRRIRALVKAGQFSGGDTILAIETTMQALPEESDYRILRTYPDPHTSVATSGILWYAIFGQEGMPVFRPTEFEGCSNLDGNLVGNGVLNTEDDVRGILIFDGPRISGMVRASEVNTEPGRLIRHVGEYWNTECNDALCRLALDERRHQDWHRMCEVKSFELWDERLKPLWDASDDWHHAREALGLPECFAI